MSLLIYKEIRCCDEINKSYCRNGTANNKSVLNKNDKNNYYIDITKPTEI